MKTFQKTNFFKIFNVKNIFYVIAIAVSLILTLFPLYYLISNSFKNVVEFIAYPPTLFPKKLIIENYIQLSREKYIVTYFLNSITIATVSSLLSIFVGALAAYGFSRFEFPFSKHIFFFFLIVRMIPGSSLILPIFLFMYRLHLLDTKIAVILAHMTFQLPFIIWLLNSFYKEMPKEYEEAAWIDGCSKLKTIFKIVIPLSIPSLISVLIFAFTMSWNDFVWVFALTQSSKSNTLPVIIASWITPYKVEYGNMFAGAFIFTIPIIIFSFIIQKYLTAGMRLGV